MPKKGSMDDEALCIQRCAREIEKLDDVHAEARVSFYLYLRYTAAGSRIAASPSEPPVESSPMLACSTESSPTPDAAVVDSDPPPAAENEQPEGADAPEQPRDRAPVVPPMDGGWDLSGSGSEDDDSEEEIQI